MGPDARGGDDRGMNSGSQLHDRASDIVEAARGFQAAAEEPTSHAAAPDSLAALEEALQALSAAWYQLAADAAPACPRVDGLSREQEVRLMGSLHDVAAAFARCARACRDGRFTVAPIIARRDAPNGRGPSDGFPHFPRRQRPTGRAA
jgi:hypothetical protein